MALKNSSPTAVIDIGSNSVRMVIYHALSRVPMPLFNEKYYCALAHDLAHTGRLNPEGIKEAKQAFARFMLMLERFKIRKAHIIATSAVRDAEDGPDFVKALEKKCGIKVHVIDGEREAQLAAQGVQASIWQAEGLCADLGGGSLELAQLKDGNIHHSLSLPLGALRLLDDYTPDDPTLRDMLREEFAKLDWLKRESFTQCYAIGGSLRSLAKMHERQTDYPLRLVHEYHLSDKRIKTISEELCAMNSEQRACLPGISSKRADTSAIAAVILDELLRASGASRAIFSVAGIREGLIYEKLGKKTRACDPLQASAEVLETIAGRHGHYAEELFSWMQPLFVKETYEAARLRRALCHISEIAWTIDPNFRAEWSYLRVLQSDMKGLSHAERVMLAIALFHRYQAKWKCEKPQQQLLNTYEFEWARSVGIAANLAFQLSGGQAGHLHHSKLYLDDEGQPQLKLDKNAAPLYTETVAKRLVGLGSAISAFSSSRK